MNVLPFVLSSYAIKGRDFGEHIINSGKQMVKPVYTTAYNLAHSVNPIYPTNSIVTVNFDLGENEMYKDVLKIDNYADYKFDVAIILDYNDEIKKYQVMLGIGEEIWVGYRDITSVIRYPVNAEYFGRNPKYVKQYNADSGKWESVDEKSIVSSEGIYDKKYLESIQKQKMDANLPSSLYHYRLPHKNKPCTQKKNICFTNNIVVINPVTWKSDVYEEVVAIILECNYDTKNYTVVSFESPSHDVIPEENIVMVIRCPRDGEYFGRFSNRSMKFNGSKNTWEDVPEEEIEKDRVIINAHWKTCRDNIRALQHNLQKNKEYEGGRKTRHRKRKNKKRIKQKTHRRHKK